MYRINSEMHYNAVLHYQFVSRAALLPSNGTPRAFYFPTFRCYLQNYFLIFSSNELFYGDEFLWKREQSNHNEARMNFKKIFYW